MYTQTKQVRTANLLGVAGTDIPVAEVKKRTPAYKVLHYAIV